MILTYCKILAVVMVFSYGQASTIVNYTIKNDTYQSVSYDHCDVLFNNPVCRNYVVDSGDSITFSSRSLRDKTVFEIKNIRMGRLLCVQDPLIKVIDQNIKITVNQLGLSNCQVDLSPLVFQEGTISEFEVSTE